MELKVWVEGIQRIVCGVTDVTTCQDVVYALAHATGKTGRFTLMERWRNSERLLAPQEHPLKILLKWGEYASDVQFILQRTALEPKGDIRPPESKGSPHVGGPFAPHQRPGPPPIPGGPQRISHKGGDVAPTRPPPQSPPQGRDIKKSLTFSGGHSPHLECAGSTPHPTEGRKDDVRRLKDREDPGVVVSGSPVNTSFEQSPPGRAEDRAGSPVKVPINNLSSPAPPGTPLDNSFNGEDAPPENREEGDDGDINDNLIPSVMSCHSNKSSVALNKSLRETLKRDGSSPSPEGGEKGTTVQNLIKQLVKGSGPAPGAREANHRHPTEEVVLDGYYRELVNLVNQQREKICAQQVDLTKFEAEIAFSEGRSKEEESRLAFLQQEIQRLEKASKEEKQPSSNVDSKLLADLEEQLKAAKKAETTSEEEIADIQTRIAACDHQLTQLNARIRSIEEALGEEEALQQEAAAEQAEQEEQEALHREVSKLQAAVSQSTEHADHLHALSHQLAQEMSEAEARLEEKRREVDALKQAMREANLEALSMTPPAEETPSSSSETSKSGGNAKAGSNRRMVGSPRQLETAVPTSKNPHGVWV